VAHVSLDENVFNNEGVQNGTHFWYTQEGDGVGLYYYCIAPDLPRNQTNAQSFWEEYRKLIEGHLVEVGIVNVCDLTAVRAIGKVPQNPAVITYLGSYTFQLLDRSYVLKVQSEERGITGIREAVLFDIALATGEIENDSSGNICGDLYTDDEVFDKDFPGYPLSCCRRALKQISLSLTVSSEMRKYRKFVFLLER